MTDSPDGYACCSAYKINIAFAVLWLVLVIVVGSTRNIARTGLCGLMGALHIAAVLYLRRRFKKYGSPSATPNFSSMVRTEVCNSKPALSCLQTAACPALDRWLQPSLLWSSPCREHVSCTHVCMLCTILGLPAAYPCLQQQQ